ncbi:hypothetical protein OJ998_13650 [Solirubrobacter taibaiensis]|nr:hypothetical protein [Solirubrobacter taibaiensis]
MGEDPNQQGGSRRWITTAVEDSLRRLGTDYIDSGIEREVLPLTQRYGMGTLVWRPFGQGLLTGRVRSNPSPWPRKPAWR